jgi:hypothetical protein
MTYEGDWRTVLRPDVPSAARMYDYLLGGKDNYAADRAMADTMLAQLPNLRQTAHYNRAFLRRVVRYLVREAGIRQIIDIGAGLPTVGNTHEVARAIDPATRIVYVDHDPVVLSHGRMMLDGVTGATIIRQDLLEPDKILADHELRSLIDFTEPVALLFLAVLHFASDQDDPARLIATLLDPFPSGSYVAISHITADETPKVTEAARELDESTQGVHIRSRAAIAGLVAGMDILEPGVVWPPLWRPDPDEVVPSDTSESYLDALLARKP